MGQLPKVVPPANWWSKVVPPRHSGRRHLEQHASVVAKLKDVGVNKSQRLAKVTLENLWTVVMEPKDMVMIAW